MARPRTLVPRLGYQWGLVIVLVLAAAFRLWHLGSLPPGLAPDEARLGLAAQALAHQGHLPSWGRVDGASPLLVVLLALAVKLFGSSVAALRLMSALLGIAGVATTYGWARAWFGRRTGLITAFLVAVSPWAVTISRNVEPASLALLLVTSLLWLASLSWHYRRPRTALALALISLLTVTAGPVGWAVLVIVVVASLTVWLSHRRPQPSASWLVVGAVIVFAVAGAAAFARLPLASSGSVQSYVAGAAQTIGAVAIHGDDDWRHNLGGQPLLNVFVCIMLVAGLLVSVTRWRQHPVRALLLGTLAGLVPALLSPETAPNAARLAPALPLIACLAALGIGYMLEVWYATFPINSAARLTGQSAILILLALTAYQGYTQYFVAWAGSSEAHRAYADDAVAMAAWQKAHPSKSPRLIVADQDEILTLSYLLDGQSGFRLLTDQQLAAAHPAKPLSLISAVNQRAVVVATLKTEAPGGTFHTSTSSFDQAELFDDYELP